MHHPIVELRDVSFTSGEATILDHLATLTRNELRFAGTPAAIPVLTDPTTRQKEAFDLIGAAIPLTLKK